MKKNLVFIIEDSPLYNKTLAAALSNIESIELKSFTLVENALGNISEKPQFIILDHFLGRTNGIDSIPIFREFLPSCKIIVLSSQPDVRVLDSAFSFGADYYFMKQSSDIDEIVALLNKLINETTEKKESWFYSLLKKNEKSRKKLIYVLDDNPNSAFAIDHLLSSDTFNIVKAFTKSFDFINEYQLKKPDIVVLDYNLEEKITGLELLQKIKKESPASKVVMLSGQEDIKVAVDLIKNGASYYLVKSADSMKRIKSIVQLM